MWVYVIICIFLIYALYKERQQLGCPDVPDGSDCDNANGKAVIGTEPHPNDSTSTLFNKIRKAACYLDRVVVWRWSVIFSAIAIIIYTFFIHKRFPTEVEWAVGIFVISGLCYFIQGFYKYHLGDYIKRNIDEGCQLIELRISS
jgi:hypothetical protein